MKFGPVPVGESAGTILAHSQRLADRVLRKGHRITEADAAALASSGLAEVTVARLTEEDVHEDAAAAALAERVGGPGIRVDKADTGRANLYAERDGLVTVDAAAVNALNAVDPALTLATLAAYRRVAVGRMVGTVKVIPFAVRRASLDAALSHVTRPILSVTPWSLKRVAALSTMLPTLKDSVIDKTIRTFDGRLADTGAGIVRDERVAHEAAPLAKALADSLKDAEMAVVFGASAVVDEDDVIPEAIARAGGRVERFGMPVDPGNLLVLGEIDGKPVIGAPGCARSPKENGFDWVLDRLLAGIAVTGEEIAGMGVGGLLMETAARPHPRRGKGRAGKTAAVVLAAGRSSRMGSNKLVAEVAGQPMVRRVAEAALASRADVVVVVTGHEPERVEAALEGLDVTYAPNPHYADGLSTSLRAGLSAVPEDVEAALILLGDMPLVTAEDCNKVLAGLSEPDTLVAIATANGARGNPVAWSRRLFPELKATEGDAGGRALLSRYADNVTMVEIGRAGALDADTPDALSEVRSAAGGVAAES
ncbi:4-diphosphocytidyl-2C-methyl-D-erythritol kinase [Acuticoccus sediminis]|uniref:4-diphosphocytidyl-2C-methyl-D-erythritol kinase n=1 Tax=Acuticoccus sediminis TaxID=2184697 RepID=A0A8B2P1N4_9HYPH|nr:molybdopterin-binding/glycosyltransferase family 2 protein [Acuticoccus sediminis]RAI03874.1 4-diphosphocytidyl-2C-methyl-D-erythritol kinase [Acuticoccus sediminis]